MSIYNFPKRNYTQEKYEVKGVAKSNDENFCLLNHLSYEALLRSVVFFVIRNLG
jgi:hypothetical protein